MDSRRSLKEEHVEKEHSLDAFPKVQISQQIPLKPVSDSKVGNVTVPEGFSVLYRLC
jgi:hypothetical protein